MKKHIILFIISVVVFSKINAQQYIPFPTDSSQWSVVHTHSSPFSQNTFQYKMKGDTILNGITYHKIYYSPDLYYSSPNQTLHCFVRENTTKKVFVKYPSGMSVDTSEFMLYNFNLVVGDTVPIRLLHYTTDSLFKLVVISIDSNQFSTGYRKYFSFQAITSIWGGGTICDNIISWTEGMGSNRGLLYDEFPEQSCTIAGIANDLRCFWYKGIYVAGGNFCDVSTAIDEVKDSDNQSYLFPNPVNNISFIEFSDKQYTNMEIYNMLGEKVKDINVKDLEKVFLNKIDFSSGIFIYRLISQNGYYQTGNFVVQK